MYDRTLISLLVLAMLSTAVAGCGGNGGGDAPPVQYPYSQADLAGTWYFTILQTGPSVSNTEPGWMRGWASVDASGNVSVHSADTNLGSFPPALLPWGLVWTIDRTTGVISETAIAGSTSANPDFHGKLASGKRLIIGTATNQNGAPPGPAQLRVMQKLVSSVTYSLADLANKDFMVHQIETGGSSGWMHAAGSTDASGQVTIPVYTSQSGTAPGGATGFFSIHPGTGIVSVDTNTWFQGRMTADKSIVIGTESSTVDSSVFRFTVIQVTDPAVVFAQADLEDDWSVHGMISAGMWLHTTMRIDAAGTGTFAHWVDSEGGTPPSPTFTLDLATDGIVTTPTDTWMHGMLSLNKDLLVWTQNANGDSLMGIGVK